MNKTLNTEELQQLRDFIQKRCFRDEVVVNEILDHFACKVEEVISENHGISLKGAMAKAHQSFGRLGFYIIKSNLERNTAGRYRRIYWQSVKSVFTSVPELALIILVWLGTYNGFIWACQNHYAHIWGENDFAFGTWLCMLGCLIALVIKFPRGKNYYQNIGLQYGFWFMPILFPVILSQPQSDKAAIFYALSNATAVALFLVFYIARITLLKAASKDHEEYRAVAE